MPICTLQIRLAHVLRHSIECSLNLVAIKPVVGGPSDRLAKLGTLEGIHVSRVYQQIQRSRAGVAILPSGPEAPDRIIFNQGLDPTRTECLKGGCRHVSAIMWSQVVVNSV